MEPPAAFADITWFHVHGVLRLNEDVETIDLGDLGVQVVSCPNLGVRLGA